MNEGIPACKTNKRLWQSMVRLSAGMLTRDFGTRAHQQALRRANREAAINERAFLFWRDVADEIAQEGPEQSSLPNSSICLKG